MAIYSLFLRFFFNILILRIDEKFHIFAYWKNELRNIEIINKIYNNAN